MDGKGALTARQLRIIPFLLESTSIVNSYLSTHNPVLSGCLTFNDLFCIVKVTSGAVAQLGERLNGIQEVVGSIPIGSTIRLAAIPLQLMASQ